MKRTIWIGALAASAALVTLVAPKIANAQPGNWTPPPPPAQVVKQHKRNGLTIGLAVGPALGDDSKNQTGAMVNFSIGWFLNPRTALLLDVHGFESDDFSDVFCELQCDDQFQARSMGVTGAGLQWWLSDRIWAKGTLGVGTATVGGLGDLEGLGWASSIGWDFYSGQSFAVDARFDVMGVSFEEGSSSRAGLGLGLAWR